MQKLNEARDLLTNFANNEMIPVEKVLDLIQRQNLLMDKINKQQEESIREGESNYLIKKCN